MSKKCPKCESPQPHLYPAVAFEGEVGDCLDPFHRIITPQNTAEKIRYVDDLRARMSPEKRSPR